MQSREAIISPLQLVGWLGKVDIEAHVEGGIPNALPTTKLEVETGETAKAVSIRWGIATALVALGADTEKLRLAGYLVRDNRKKERTKVGRVGARARWTWKKR